MKQKLSLQEFCDLELMAREDQRLPGEPQNAYHAYLLYRGLGPCRDLREAWRMYRDRPTDARKSRGRPRLANAKPGRVSGQWTMWCSEWKWKERAAVYDGFADTGNIAVHRLRIEQQQNAILDQQIASINTAECSISELDSALDELVDGPITGYSRTTREMVGRKVIRKKIERVDPIDCFPFIEYVKLANQLGRKIMLGRWQLPGAIRRIPDGAAYAHLIGRQPGESVRAYKAFCFYRDQGPGRSLRAAYAAYQRIVRASTRSDGCTPPERPTRRSAGHWPEWSRRWEWAQRATAYDCIKRQTELRRRDELVYRLERFEIANQPRTMQRFRKIAALLSRVCSATPAIERTITQITNNNGHRRTIITTHEFGVRRACVAIATLVKLELQTAEHAVGDYGGEIPWRQ